MRRWAMGISFFFATLLLPIPVAAAEAAPDALCSLEDSRLLEVSGIATTEGGYAVINDKGNDLRIYHLTDECVVEQTKVYNRNPRDPEDLAVDAQGTLWAADIGDNARERSTVAVWKVPQSGDPSLYRMTYPDNPHDAEAMLMPSDERPIIITKEVTGVAKLYRARDPLQGEERTITLEAVGSLTLKETGTEGGPEELGAVPEVVVTGAALSPDGSRAVVRTYTDAYEWDVSEGSIAKTLTETEPRRTPLPGEPQGEAITYTSDGKQFVTVSEGKNQPVYRWTPTALKSGEDESTGGAKDAADETPWYQDITLTSIMRIVYGVGALGVILLILGIVGILRHRKRVRAEKRLEARQNAVMKGGPEAFRAGSSGRPPGGERPPSGGAVSRNANGPGPNSPAGTARAVPSAKVPPPPVRPPRPQTSRARVPQPPPPHPHPGQPPGTSYGG